jgi:hypothetical protein
MFRGIWRFERHICEAALGELEEINDSRVLRAARHLVA